jgi:hypothetical protein
MPSYKSAFGSFLKTEDLQGRRIPATIERVTFETIEGRRASRAVRRHSVQ